MNVPGIGAGKYDNLVEALMKKERVPRDNAAEELKRYEQQNTVWRKINYLSGEVREKTRELYSFNNPFVEKTVTASNEQVLTATATRDAREQNFKISITQIAKADAFLSKEIAKDYQIPKGTYTFTAGEKSVSVQWSGGKYRNFINLINKRGKGIVHVSEIKTNNTASVLLFESQISGSANKLLFSDDALSFALENGILRKDERASFDIAKTETVAPPRTTERIDFPKVLRATQDLMLEYSFTIQENELEETQNNSNQINNQQQSEFIDEGIYELLGAVTFQDITITNAPSEPFLSAANEHQTQIPAIVMPAIPQEVTEDNNILSLLSSRGTLLPLPAADIDTKTVTVPLSEYGDVKGITVHNNNSHKTVRLSGLRIYDPKSGGDYAPISPVSQAQDAVVQFEGITVTRTKNDIDDLIPGVTLHLHDKTDKLESIDIKPDTEAAKTAIIELVAKYNRLIAEINIVTSKQQAVIDEINYFTDDERKTAEENLGMLSGDMTLASFKSKLRLIVSNLYRQNDDASIRSLSQIGISTRSDTGSNVSEARMRGYLEIDEKKLDEALKNSMQEVRYLFGYDTDGDILIDNGVAFQLFTQIDPYTQRGGIFSARTNGLNAQITGSKEKIKQYDKDLERKEKELKYKYGVMDGSLRKLQKQSNAIESFNQQKRN